MPTLLRFLLFLLPCTLLRFYLGESSFSFLWFLVLYSPFINWCVYWVMLAVRALVNRWLDDDRITVTGTRTFFIRYLNLPGALVAAEIIYQGYLFNR
jgi:hypothetical protein